MQLFGDLIQNIAIVGLMLTVYRLRKIVNLQNEVVHILCKWQFKKDKNLI